MNGIVDSHAHICGDALVGRFDEVVREAKKAGITKILVVCISLEEAKRALVMTKGNPMFDVAAGFYPNELLHLTKED